MDGSRGTRCEVVWGAAGMVNTTLTVVPADDYTNEVYGAATAS